jgi:ParB family chromosome partitioning protein
LFGGANIPTANALFDVDASGLEIVSDLFGDEAYFTDADSFWAQQNTAIAAAVDGYNTKGWADVVIMDIGAYFTKWDHIRTDIDDSGKVFVTCSNQGEVAFHEGYLSNAEARRRTTADSGAMPTPKPELTKAAQNYVDLHRHAAIRGDLLGQSGIALRLIAAHMIAGSSLWNVQADPQKAAKPEIAESLEVNTGQVTVQQERAKIVQMLGLESCDSILEHRNDYTPRPCVTEVFANAQTLNDEDMLRVLTFLMADSLSVQSPLLDILGQALQTDMQTHWIPDQTFFDLIRDKTVLNTMVGTLAGDTAAKQNVTATAKAQRAILTACLDGTRPSCIKTWIPPHMAFPARTYRQSETAEPQVVADPAEVSQAEAA